jgi:hypothetical protein
LNEKIKSQLSNQLVFCLSDKNKNSFQILVPVFCFSEFLSETIIQADFHKEYISKNAKLLMFLEYNN